MKWQEYQSVVGTVYEQAEGIGTVRKNVTLHDKVTGQPRQVDTWVDIETKGHAVGILIDAKFRDKKINVKEVEEVESLGRAVGANKVVIVCPNGWTEPAEKRAAFSGIDLRLLTIEGAVEFLDPDKWRLCPVCEKDCIVMDHDGAIELNGAWLWWLAGQCRECRAGIAWCQDCGDKVVIHVGREHHCNCGHSWRVEREGMLLRLNGSDRYLAI
jgi:hypothetical protein